MLDNPGTNHIEIDVNKALRQMLIRFNCCRMIPIFPVGSFPALSLIEFLARPSGNQLDRFGYYVSITIIPDKKMNVIRGHGVIEHAKAVTLLASKSHRSHRRRSLANLRRNSFL